MADDLPDKRKQAQDVEAFLSKVEATPKRTQSEGKRGKLLFAMDATASRQPTWDKAASIRFRKPGQGHLHASFTIPKDDIEAVRDACASAPDGKHDRTYAMQWIDRDGDVVAEVEKVLHFRRNDAQ